MKILQIYIKPMACKKSTISTGGEEKTEKQEALDIQEDESTSQAISPSVSTNQCSERFLFFLIFSSFLWIKKKCY